MKFKQFVCAVITGLLLYGAMVQVNAESSKAAGIYYVSPKGSDSNPGTFALPYYSLASAVAVAAPGSTIYMRGGNYNYTSTIVLTTKATAAAPIKILAYEKEKPVLSWSSWKPANKKLRAAARGFLITGNYWTLKGLEISYAPDNGVKCEGAHNTFELCVFHHNGDSGIQIGLNKETYTSNPDPENLASYNTVRNCDSYLNVDPGTNYENADGFSCKLYAGKGNYFYGCRAWRNCDDGWDCYQTNYQIIIENCWTWHNGDPSIWGFTSFNGDGNGFKLGGNNEPCPILIKNCVAFNSNYGAKCGFSDNNNGAAITVLNCTAWACGKDFKLKNQAHVVKNCLAFDPKLGTKYTRDLDKKVVSVNNSWDLTSLTANYDDLIKTSEDNAAAARQADGSLPNNGFARLVSGSDLIDKGVDVGLTYYGSAPDLGAYESNY